MIRGHSAAYAFALFERLGHMEIVSDEVERERPVDADDGVEPVASAAYMVYISRGGWWKGLNACGEVVPEGNRPIEGKLVIAAIEAGCEDWTGYLVSAGFSSGAYDAGARAKATRAGWKSYEK